MGLSATLIQLWLSSQTLQRNLEAPARSGKTVLISCMRFKKGITSLKHGPEQFLFTDEAPIVAPVDADSDALGLAFLLPSQE